MHSGNICTSLITLALLYSCGRYGAPVGEQQVLNAIGFTKPIVITLSLNSPSNGVLSFEDSFDQSSLNVSAALLKAGYIKIVASPDSAPWYQVKTTNDSDSNLLQFEVGNRVIQQTSDEKNWQDGSVQYYAETISYAVKMRGGLEQLLSGDADFHIRVVLENDPAVGHWQISERSDFASLTMDTQAVTTELTKVGE